MGPTAQLVRILSVSACWRRGLAQLTLANWLYAALSLTVVRMLPVAIALIGTRLNRATVLFMGWFGPRGLASIVLGLVYLEQEAHLPGESTIRLTVMMTVWLSIFAHGLSALPGINFYRKKSCDAGGQRAGTPGDNPKAEA